MSLKITIDLFKFYVESKRKVKRERERQRNKYQNKYVIKNRIMQLPYKKIIHYCLLVYYIWLGNIKLYEHKLDRIIYTLKTPILSFVIHM